MTGVTDKRQGGLEISAAAEHLPVQRAAAIGRCRCDLRVIAIAAPGYGHGAVTVLRHIGGVGPQLPVAAERHCRPEGLGAVTDRGGGSGDA